MCQCSVFGVLSITVNVKDRLCIKQAYRYINMMRKKTPEFFV